MPAGWRKLKGHTGIWRTHRYPGIRSDSYTFGYRFKPWTGAPIATAQEILRYMGEVIVENGLAPHIRYRHRIASAAWSSLDKRVGDRLAAPFLVSRMAVFGA